MKFHASSLETFVLGFDVLNLETKVGVAVITDRTVCPDFGWCWCRIFEDLYVGVDGTKHRCASHRAIKAYKTIDDRALSPLVSIDHLKLEVVAIKGDEPIKVWCRHSDVVNSSNHFGSSIS